MTVVAIDGPVASGKSTVARRVARRLGYLYLDTGAMYRAVTCAFLAAGVDPGDAQGVIATTLGADLQISTDPDDQWVRVNGQDVTTEIREPSISATVSAVSTLAECRANLVERQRRIIDQAPAGVVAEGRDITTVVAPDADVRVLLVGVEADVLAVHLEADIIRRISIRLYTQKLAKQPFGPGDVLDRIDDGTDTLIHGELLTLIA